MNEQQDYVVPDITIEKNLGLSHVADYTMSQPVERYTAEDHAVWQTLYARQAKLLPGRACDEFLQGMSQLRIDPDRVPEFDRLSERLAKATGWTIVAVHGLIPDDVFFEHLANRRFPVTWWLRGAHQLDYLQEPDVFHDLFGHVPLLANPVFADYLQAYGVGGLKAKAHGALPLLARLYWYTVEFGLIRTDQGLRIYGAGIVSSKAESLYCLDSVSPNRVAFDLLRIMRTRYRIDTFQKTYFVIDSFQQLFDATAPDFVPHYQALVDVPVIGAGDLLETDLVLNRGTGEDWGDTPDV